jgi:Ca-activated chloride channel family protein
MNHHPYRVTSHDEPGFGFGALEAGDAPLPLARIDLHARIRGVHAHVTVVQEFRNYRREPLEVTYVCPTPALGAITGYTFTVDGVTTCGVLMAREEARVRYDDAIAAGHTASTLEEDRPEVLTVRVGNLPPSSTARVRIELDLILPLADDTAVLRLPLVVGARYVPGSPLGGPPAGTGTFPDTDDAPDASRVTPPIAAGDTGVRVGVVVDVVATDVVASHPITIERAAGSSRVRLVDVVPDRDVILRFPLLAADEALYVADPEGGDGTVVATVCGHARPEVPPLPLDVAIVIDRSGSMNGEKIVAARRAATQIVESLTPGDRVIVVAFDDRLDLPLGTELVAATASQRRRASEFLDDLTARGGTHLAPALDLALAALESTDRERRRRLVLVTDGQIANEDQIVALVLRRHSMILSVAIGPAVNQGLCQRLAMATGGDFELALTDRELRPAIERTVRRLMAPALELLELEIAGARLVEGSRAPRLPPSLVAGIPAVLAARVHGRPTAVALHAVDDHGRAVKRTLPLAEVDLPALPRAWARLRLRDLEDHLLVTPVPEAIAVEDELVETSLRYGVMSRYTAFVAIDPRRRVARAPVARIAQPVLAVEPVPRSSGNTRSMVGTVRRRFAYMSPEQVRGYPSAPASDVFTLAAILTQLVQQRQVFPGETELERLQNMVNGTPDIALPAQLAVFNPVFRAALAPTVAARIPDGAALLRALAALALRRDPIRRAAPIASDGLRGPIAARRRALWITGKLAGVHRADLFAAIYAGPLDGALPDAIVLIPSERSERGDPICIESPCVARLLGVVAAPRRAHVIERIRGRTLGELGHELVAAKLELTAGELFGIAIDCATALAMIHERGIIHRDLSWSSFVVTSERTVLVELPDAPKGTALPRLAIPLRGMPIEAR